MLPSDDAFAAFLASISATDLHGYERQLHDRLRSAWLGFTGTTRVP